MSVSIKHQRITRCIQKTLGELMCQKARRLLRGHMVSVTEVIVAPDLSLAKVYLSTIGHKPSTATIVDLATQNTRAFRGLLGQQLGNKLRKIPELRFYADESAAHATKINKLLDSIDIPATTTESEAD